MQFESFRSSSSGASDFFQRPLIMRTIIVFLFVSALGIRLYHIGMPPLDFSSVRQYQCAHNARAYYFNTFASVPEERRKMADINAGRVGFDLEPRVMEYLAVAGYRLAGEEKLWIPRLISAIFWTVGGLFLFLTAGRIAGRNAALLSTAFYFFLPYSISASRSFQPDPMMIMLLMISIYAILLHHEQPSKRRLLAAAGVSALAMFIKPYCVFLIFGAVISLAVKRRGTGKAIFDPNVLLFSFISVTPVVVYYGYSSFTQADAQAHIQSSFLPHLLLKSYFWKDWLFMIGNVTGYAAFAFALAGLFMSTGLLRTILTGLWTGYFVFGLIFTYHIHTHSYYHLQFIPVAALSLVPAAAGIRKKFSVSSKKYMPYFIALFVSAILFSGYIVRTAQLRDYKSYLRPLGAVVGINPEFYRFLANDYYKEAGTLREIGELVGHSANNVFLTSDYGRSLTYHGELSGLPWPTAFSMQSRREMNVPVPSKEEIFNSRYLLIRTHKSSLFNTKTIHGDYIQYTPDYFIITSLEEFDAQPDLKAFLYTNFPVLAQREGYLIFDLRKMSER